MRGPFADAHSERIGILKFADHSLLFLDEIGKLGLDEQAMLLRAVEDMRFSRSALTRMSAATSLSAPAPTAISAEPDARETCSRAY